MYPKDLNWCAQDWHQESQIHMQMISSNQQNLTLYSIVLIDKGKDVRDQSNEILSWLGNLHSTWTCPNQKWTKRPLSMARIVLKNLLVSLLMFLTREKRSDLSLRSKQNRSNKGFLNSLSKRTTIFYKKCLQRLSREIKKVQLLLSRSRKSRIKRWLPLSRKSKNRKLNL
jgi:hypothetical protein